MPIVFSCTGCKKKYEVGDHLAGKQGRCKQCGAQFRIPVPRSLATTAASKPQSDPEILDDFEEEDDFPDRDDLAGTEPDDDDVAPHSQALSYGSEKFAYQRRPSATGSGSNSTLLLAMILGGGALLIILILGFVVLRSRQKAAQVVPDVVETAEANAAAGEGQAAAVASGPVVKASLDLSQFPALPPLPAALSGTVRDLSQHREALQDQIQVLNQFADILASIHDQASAQAALPRFKEFNRKEAEHKARFAHLFNPTNKEMAELIRPRINDLRAVMNRLRQEAHRLATDGGVASARKYAQEVDRAAKQAEGLYALATGPTSYVEVFISGAPDSDTTDAVIERLRNLGDAGRLQIQFVGDLVAHRLSVRLWPVGDATSFAGRIGFGQTSVAGKQIEVSGVSIPAQEVAELKAKKEAEKARRAAEVAAAFAPKDPQPPAGADPLTVALFRLKSSDQGKVREGLETLARMIPDESRKSEVSAAIVPLVASPDGWTAEAAVKAIPNWTTPEGVKAIIHALKNDDRHGVLRTAILTLGKMKDPSAAPAIASRIREFRIDTVEALKAIGPDAEPAVIPVLSRSDPDERNAACEVLKEIGGQATLDAMKTLPADRVDYVRMSAADTMRTIAARLSARRRLSSDRTP